MLFNIPTFGIIGSMIIFLIIIISISIHECSHALIAFLRGDHTAKLSGRLTLNPAAHFDPFGFFLILVSNFGWGKPVPVNPYNMPNPKWDNLLVAIGGPISNIATAILSSIILRLLTHTPISGEALNAVIFIFSWFIIINIGLAIFNLLPIPPLDGSNIYKPFLPLSWQYNISQFSGQYIFFILILAFIPLINGQSLISAIISPIIGFISSILVP